MIIEKEIIVNKDIKAAWKVLGLDFAEAYKWATPVNHSVGSGEGFDGASCSERGCDISGMGKIRERIVKYSNEDHLLSHTAEGMPAMVKEAVNNWKLTSLDTNKSKLNMKLEITLGGLMGMLMQPVMKIMMSKMASQIIEDFKYYVENGQPSPSKLKAAKKYGLVTN